MKHQVGQFMPCRFGTTAGSAEFEAVAKQFRVDIKTLAKADEESLKGLSNETKEDVVGESRLSSSVGTYGIPSDAAGSLKNPIFRNGDRQISAPECLACNVSQDSSFTKSKFLRDGKKPVCHDQGGNHCSNPSPKKLNLAEKKRQDKRVIFEKKEECSLSLVDTEDTKKIRQKINYAKVYDRLSRSSDSKKLPVNNLMLSNRNPVNSEALPTKDRNIRSWSLVSDVCQTNGQWRSHELPVRVDHRRSTRRKSLPSISQSTLNKSSKPSLPRRNYFVEQFKDDVSKSAKSDACLAVSGDSLLLNSRPTTSSNYQSSHAEANFEKYKIGNSRSRNSEKNWRPRKTSLPVSLQHRSPVGKNSDTSKSLDDFGQVFPRKTDSDRYSIKELVQLDDELPCNLAENVNPEHIFRLWNVKLPKQLANKLRIELTQKNKEG